jgi:hypothetical protein
MHGLLLAVGDEQMMQTQSVKSSPLQLPLNALTRDEPADWFQLCSRNGVQLTT